MCAIISEKNGFTAYNEGGGYYIYGGRLSMRGTEDPADLIADQTLYIAPYIYLIYLI